MRSLLVLCLVAGCDLYWNSGPGHGDDVCAVEKTPAQPQVRDPSSGSCITSGPPYGGGGGGNCACEACPDQTGSGSSDVNWPLCTGSCDSLTEDACQATSGCHAAYETDLGDDTGTRNFIGCWNLPAYDQQMTGACTGLDAEMCAMHDNCASLLAWTAQGALAFDQCLDETHFCLQDSDCGAGNSCDTSVCHTLPCNPGPEGGACAEPCWGVCAVTPCEALTTEQTCTARSDCQAVYVGQNCTCDSSGNCTCETETYDHCESTGKL